MNTKACKGSLISVLFAILIVSIIYQSGSVQAANNPDDLLFQVTRILMLIMPIIMCFFSGGRCNHQFLKGLLLITIIVELLALINFFLFSESAVKLQFKILNLVLFLLAIHIAEQSSVNMLLILYKILIWIAVITLVFYVAVDLIHIPLPYSIFSKSQGGTFTYRNYFNIYYTYSHARIPRLCGLFWEPGAYQIYLNLGLFLYYKLNIENKKHLFILLISVFFAQSTTGYMIAVIMLALIVIRKQKNYAYTLNVIRILGGICAVAIVLIAFMYKKSVTNVAGDSYFDRIAQTKLGLELFVENPIFGWGFYNTDKYNLLNKAGVGNANGLVTWLYTTGLVGFVFAFFPFITNIRKTKNENLKVEKIIWLVFLIIENMSEPFYALPITIFILAKEYYPLIESYKRKPYKQRKKSDYLNAIGKEQ